MRTELVGREQELAALVEHLESALAAHPRVVLCRGEPGIGKTRMAEELTGLAAPRGVAAAWGPAAESSGALPYWPWRQVLRAMSAGVDIADIADIADELGLTPDLVRLAPDVFDASAGDPGGSGLGAERFRLFDAVARLLSEIAVRAPWLIVLDDAHRADYGSLLLLHHVVRALTRERLLVMVNIGTPSRCPTSSSRDLPGSRSPGGSICAVWPLRPSASSSPRWPGATSQRRRSLGCTWSRVAIPSSSVRWAGRWPRQAQPGRPPRSR